MRRALRSLHKKLSRSERRCQTGTGRTGAGAGGWGLEGSLPSPRTEPMLTVSHGHSGVILGVIPGVTVTGSSELWSVAEPLCLLGCAVDEIPALPR